MAHLDTPASTSLPIRHLCKVSCDAKERELVLKPLIRDLQTLTYARHLALSHHLTCVRVPLRSFEIEVLKVN